MEEEKVLTKCGATSSKVARLDYIPLVALERLADRYAHGMEKHGKYNYKRGLREHDYVLERCAHIIKHAYKYIAVLEGLIPDDGDDNAAAIMWGGAFLIEADEEQKKYAPTIPVREGNDTPGPEITEQESALDKFKKLFKDFAKGEDA